MGITSSSKKDGGGGGRGASPTSPPASSPTCPRAGHAHHQNPPSSRPTSLSEPNVTLLPSAEPNNNHDDQTGSKQRACNQGVHEHTTTHLPRHTSPHHHQHSSAGHLGTTTKLAADLETPSGFCCCCRRAPPTGPSRHEHASADQGGLGEPDRTGGETVHYTAYHAAQDSRAGACLVAWPPTHHSYPTTPPTTARQSATATADDNLDHEQQTREERSEEAKTGSSYLTLEAALDARRGACFVAWPTDEEWRVPTLCV